MFNIFDCFIEKHIGTIAFVGLWYAIVPIRIVKIIISPIVRCLTYTTTAMSDYFLEASVFWAERIIVT